MWNDGKEEATDQVVNLALVRSLVDPSTREEGTRGRKEEEEEGDEDGWKRAGRRQSDVKADRRPVTPSHVSITPSICRESLHFFFFLPLDEFYPLDATIFAKFHHQRRGLYLDYIWSAIDICHDGLESGLGFIVIRSLLLELLLLRRVNTIVPNGIYSRIFYPWTDKRKFHQQEDYI